MSAEHPIPTDSRFEDLTGRKFGKLKVLRYHDRLNKRHRFWCECDCGVQKPVRACSLKAGVKSCGFCEKKKIGERSTTHGDSKKRLYWIYRSMIERCEDWNARAYRYYGALGVTIAAEWRANYVTFREWALAHGYDDSLTIERKDPRGDYSPDNCCWIPRPLQAANKRTTIYATAFGETRTIIQWSKDPRCSTTWDTIRRRIHAGWDHEKAITTPDRTMHRLQKSDIPEIRIKLAQGIPMIRIAAEKGVSISTIMDIKRGTAWRDA